MRLGLSPNSLEIDELWNTWMREHMVTAAYTSQLEAKRFGQSAQITEGDVRDRSPVRGF